MKMKNGVVYFNKTDRKNIEILLAHAEQDISFGGGGTYNLGDEENTFDAKTAKKAQEAIESIRWILEQY